MNWVRIYPITIVALLSLVAFPFAYAGQITIYGEEGGTRVIETPDSDGTQQNKGEQWHRDFKGQDYENQVTLQREQAEIAKKQEDERIATERMWMRGQQEAETEKINIQKEQLRLQREQMEMQRQQANTKRRCRVRPGDLSGTVVCY